MPAPMRRAPWRRQIPHVRVVDEPRKGLVVARETGRLHRHGRRPRLRGRRLPGPADVARARSSGDSSRPRTHRAVRSLPLLRLGLVGTTADSRLRLHAGARDAGARQVRPAHRHDLLRRQLRRPARRRSTRIGGFDTSIEFHGEDTNIGRRLFAVGRVSLFHDCYLHTSARRYVAMGKGAVFRLYVRNFTSELLHHRPKDTTHLDVRI